VRSVCDVSETDSLIAIIHGNTVPKTVPGAHWSTVPTGEAEQLCVPDLAFYLELTDQP
jgi:hypothetical protein